MKTSSVRRARRDCSTPPSTSSTPNALARGRVDRKEFTPPDGRGRGASGMSRGITRGGFFDRVPFGTNGRANANGRGRSVRARSSARRGAMETLASKPLLKNALICAALGCVGDSVAQRRESMVRARAKKDASAKVKKTAKGREVAADDESHDFTRTLKQAMYNFFFYGPAQHYWYIQLARWFPGRAFAMSAESLAPFGAKVFLNQAVLGPVVVATFFLWGAVWSGDVSGYPAKVRRDALPTLRAGWSFWIPASSVNFALVPTKHQVLYMSACSIVWNVILSLNLNKA